jgi:hypothetical protein
MANAKHGKVVCPLRKIATSNEVAIFGCEFFIFPKKNGKQKTSLSNC